MKSMKMKIAATIMVLIFCACSILTLISTILCINSVMTSVETDLGIVAETTNEYICARLEAYQNVVFEVGSTARLANEAISWEEKQALLEEKMETYQLANYNICGADGVSWKEGQDYSTRAYFTASMRGENYISEPMINSFTGDVNIMFTAPLWQNGQANTTPVGCVLLVPDPNFLNEIVANVSFGTTGECILVNAEGTVIAAADSGRVLKENPITLSQTDAAFSELAGLLTLATKGEEGFGEYNYKGVTKIAAYHPIDNGSGWSLFIAAEKSEFTDDVYSSILIMILVSVAFLLLGIFLAFLFGSRLAAPVTLCEKRLLLLAEGDLKTPTPEIHTKDETKRLADALTTHVSGLNRMLGDADTVLGAMASGNLSVTTQADESYVGDFSGLKNSMQLLAERLNNTLFQINEAANQVSSGSEQLSCGAQSMSQGATEQAASVEQLSSTIEEITQQIKHSATIITETTKQNQSATDQLVQSNEKMHGMVNAMGEITDASNQIQRIVKTIEDIAFQTNILALNASVEAARAGAAGKGFAVVASEVGNLATKSAEASKGTTALIESVLNAVERGKQIADDTARSLSGALENATALNTQMLEIDQASDLQAEAISQVNAGVDQISSVVQTNSATAEETAASSEELSSQAQLLKNLVSSFTLHEQTASASVNRQTTITTAAPSIRLTEKY